MAAFSELKSLEAAMGALVAKARADEATLQASWPASATAASVQSLLGGAVIEVGNGQQQEARTLHYISKSSIAPDGSIGATVPVVAPALSLDRAGFNQRVRRFAMDVVSECDASGAITAQARQAIVGGLAATFVAGPNDGTLRLQFTSSAGAGMYHDYAFTAANVESAGFALQQWVAADGQVRVAVNADGPGVGGFIDSWLRCR